MRAKKVGLIIREDVIREDVIVLEGYCVLNTGLLHVP